MNQKEKERLSALKEYNILDTLPEEELDALVKLASEICQVPIALISLIDEDRQWFKANLGLEAAETPRNISFCQYAIKGQDVYEIGNAAGHELFADNPLVTGDPNIRFYAGMPLTNPEGYSLGTLCVIDTKPKTLTEEQKSSLRTLSKFVMNNFELRRTRVKMEESRRHYQGLVEKAADIIYTCNLKGEFTFVSAAVERITGFKSEHLIGHHFSELVAEGHRKEILQFYVSQFRSNKVETRMEFPMLTASGNRIWIEQTVVLSLKDGKKEGFHGVVRDIHERKTFERQLNLANQRFEKIFSESPVAMTLSSLHPNKFYEVNKSFVELTGFAPEDVKGLNAEEIGLFSKTDRDKLLSIFERTGSIRNYEAFIRTKSNEERWVLFSTEIIENAGKKFSLSSYINITIRKKKEQELLQTKDLLAEAMSIGHMGSYENNLVTGKMTWSKEIFDIMEMDPWSEAMTANEFMKALEPDERPGAAERIKRSTERLEPYVTINRITTALGRKKWIELRVVPIIDTEGRLTKFRGTMQDITESKELQQELIRAKEQAEESGKAKELFLANMSHEIRTPMNAVLGFTDLLSETKLDEKQKEYLHAIEASGRNLMIVINDILDYSKIEAGMLSIEKIPMSIRSIFSSLAVSFNEQARQKNLDLVFTSDKEVPEVLNGDPARLTQVIINLVGNAIKFTSKGSVKVNAELLAKNEKQVTVGFSVSDTGIGIPGDKLTSVFERFNQGSNDTNRQYGGTGLGLSIVKKLVELQGGSVSITSQLQRGSTFSVIIPYDIGINEDKPNEKRSNRQLSRTRELSVLMVEDNRLNQKLAEKILLDFGFKPDIADNGQMALEKLEKNQYDVILMDMQMPVMNGYDATQAIRQTLKSNVPIIAMTAHAMASEKEKCMKLGMNDYISKPFKREDLFDKIMTVIDGDDKQQDDDDEMQAKEADESKPLDLSYLNSLAGGNQEFIKEVLEIFVQESPFDLKRIQEGIKAKDFTALREIAHKLKSSVGLMGLNEIVPVLEEMEKLGAAKEQLPRMKELFGQLAPVFEWAIEEANKMLR